MVYYCFTNITPNLPLRRETGDESSFFLLTYFATHPIWQALGNPGEVPQKCLEDHKF